MNDHDEFAERKEDVAEPEGEVEQPAAKLIDLNAASEEELQELPGIGQALAARIVAYRAESGPFREAADIVAVPGITDALYERVAPQLIAGPVELEPEDALFEPEPEDALFEPEGDEVQVVAEVAPEPEPDMEDVLFDAGAEPLPESETGDEQVWAEIEPEPDAWDEDQVPTPEPFRVEEVVAPELAAPRRGAEPPLVEIVPARVGWGRLLLVGLLSLLLGAALALAVLYGLNGSLDWRSDTRTIHSENARLAGDVAVLRGEVDQIQERLIVVQELAPQLEEARASVRELDGKLAETQAGVEAMAKELDAVHAALAGMGDAVLGLEGRVSSLEEQVGEVTWHMEALDEQLAGLTTEIGVLRQATVRFDTFLTGLRTLLDEAEGPAAETVPPRRQTPTPTPWETPTPKSMVTVIPLTSPTPTP
jgi:competence ComEA-like helix-hairpin-helix protein